MEKVKRKEAGPAPKRAQIESKMALRTSPIADTKRRVAPIVTEEEREETRFPMQEVPFEKRTIDQHRERCRELLQQMDELYADMQKKNEKRPAFFGNFVMELEKEYEEELGKTVYEIHAMERE